MSSKVSWKTDKKLQRILKQNAERRDEERYRQYRNKGWYKALTTIFILGFILYGLAVVAVGITGFLAYITFGIIAGIIMSFVV